jgi:hypothetical protein
MAPYRADAERPDTDFVLDPGRTRLFWAVKPRENAAALVRYSDAAKHPALIEFIPEGTAGRGRVLLFTTPLDARQHADGRGINDYLKNSFFFTLANRTIAYLAGDFEDANFNHVAGTPVLVPLPPAVRFPNFVLQGPGLSGADTHVPRPDDGVELRLAQPKRAGQFSVTGPNREPVAAFSLNMPSAETLLGPRIGVDSIEDVLGAKSVAEIGQTRKLSDALEGQLRQPLDLFPWLMLLLLFALAIENLLANKFYREALPRSESASKSQS